LKRTALYDAHVRAALAWSTSAMGNALALRSQIEEHHAVRRKAGAFDVSHMRVVDIAVPMPEPFCASCWRPISIGADTGQAMYSCMLNERGRCDDLIVVRWGEEVFALPRVLNAATADRDLQWMKELAYGHDLQVDCRSRPELAIIASSGKPGPSRQLAGLSSRKACCALSGHRADGQRHLRKLFATLQVSIALARLPAQVRIGRAVTCKLRSGTGLRRS